MSGTDQDQTSGKDIALGVLGAMSNAKSQGLDPLIAASWLPQA